MARKILTEENRKEIRELSKLGHTIPGLAKMFGVSERTIYRALHPENYERELARAMEYQRENIEKVRANRAAARRDYKLSFGYKEDAKIIDHLDKQENVNSYIRGLITDDMKKQDAEYEELITLAEYARLNGINPATVRQRAFRGVYKSARKMGRDWVIDKNDP